MAEPFHDTREDQTLMCAGTVSDGVCTVEDAQVRRTRHDRIHRAQCNTWEITSTTLSADTDTDVPVGHVAAALRDELTAPSWPRPAGAVTHCRVIRGTRQYRNSEGTETSVSLEQWELTLLRRNGLSLRGLVPHRDLLPQLAADLGARWVVCTAPPAGPAAELGDGNPILLNASLAGMLLHELVGHAMEECDIQPGRRVLSTGVRAVAEPPPGRATDDEGVPTGPRTVLDDGLIELTTRDRMACGPDEVPFGHAWCAPHAPAPRIRLPLLKVEVDGAYRASPPDTFIHCTEARAARYFHGRAVLDVASADLVQPSGRRPLPPLRIVVGHSVLATTAFLPPEPVSPITTGVCVKNGDALPSVVRCPPLLLRGAELWRSAQ